MSLAGKVVIVTGASSGIGATTAEAFAKHGAKVAITGRNEANLKATEAACKAANNKVELLLIIADVTVDAERIINETIEKFGKLDVLVNNAGIGLMGNILDIGVDQFDTILNTNMRSVFLLTKFAAPHLIKTQGNIVNVSSVAGLRAFPGASTYCTSKAALDQFTRCIALDLAPHNVRVNAVNPAVIITNFQKRRGMSNEEYAKYLEHCKSTH
ncbi:PREDICTED: uncharacterized oxidoreductase TM_0325-like, partial [Rhagoletis zephyria]|uniref:uncharacterized oxidoreductase TM_0325-like n=1 Tax=Rhagoletis zephyria TaxID=28612 RepID=UPI000811278E